MGVGRRREIQVDEMEWWKGLAIPREGKGNGGKERERERENRTVWESRVEGRDGTGQGGRKGWNGVKWNRVDMKTG